MKKSRDSCPVVAVTGGIGSGKSTVSRIFKEQGACVIAADVVAKTILWNDRGVNRKVIEKFGGEICDSSGKIDKDKLIAKAFQNRESAERLNAIVHPPVINKIREIIAAESSSGGHSLIVVDAALIFEAGIEDDFDRIITVAADNDLRIERMVGKHDWNRKDVLRRMEVQDAQVDHIKKSDYVIYNNGSMSELRRESLEVYEKIIRIG